MFLNSVLTTILCTGTEVLRVQITWGSPICGRFIAKASAIGKGSFPTGEKLNHNSIVSKNLWISKLTWKKYFNADKHFCLNIPTHYTPEQELLFNIITTFSQQKKMTENFVSLIAGLYPLKINSYFKISLFYNMD